MIPEMTAFSMGGRFRMREWKETALGEIADIVMGQSPEGRTCNSVGSGMPLLNGPTEFGSAYPIAVQFTTEAKKLSQANDILFCVRGSTTGRMNWSDKQYAIGRGLAAIRHKNGEEYRHYVKGLIDFNLSDLLAAATGSTFPNVSRDQLLKLKVSLPSPTEQKAIAAVLGALDDKIELNRRMNATLEAMARALFKSWFVDFDPVRAKMAGKQPFGMDAATASLFPSRLVPSPLGDIPEEWAVGELRDIVKQVNERISPDEYTASVPYVPIECISPRSVFLSSSEPGCNAQSSLITFKGNDILFGAMRPYFHKVCLAPFDGITRTTAFVLRPKIANDLPFSLFTMFSDETILYATNNSEGSTIPYAKWNFSLEKMPIIIPPENIRKIFGDIVADFLRKGLKSSQESAALAKARDYLLPKLISGDIRIPDAEKFVEAA
jgi:type I restriction enzyme, S subunit